MVACSEEDGPRDLPRDVGVQLQFFHFRVLCRFMELLLEKHPQQHIFNVGNEESTDVRSWVEVCYGTLGKTPELRYVTDDIPQRSYFPFYDYEYKLDVSEQMKLMPDTVPFDTGIAESYEWYAHNRELIVRKPLNEFISKNFK